MKKVKIITRNGMPETNSSSSHSVTISGKQNNSDPKLYNLKVDPDGVLRIANIIGNFSWSWSKYNDSYSKTLYVIGLCEYDDQKKDILVEALKEVTGAIRVEFAWEKNPLEDEAPNVDHQSREDMYSLICENKETIKDFIFNQDSWLFTGNDNDSAPEGFYEEKEKLKPKNKTTCSGNMIIHFGSEIGDFTVSLSDISDQSEVYQEVRDALEEWVNVLSQDRVEFCEPSDEMTIRGLNTIADIVGDEIVFISREAYTASLENNLEGLCDSQIVDKLIQENNPEHVFRFKYTVITDEFGSI